ncbi:MAG: hypothetical protein HY551_00650, partial [Elusimicrobia bacterium]|nr:hypothetical protein [Elusimicrobiota bacterium]
MHIPPTRRSRLPLAIVLASTFASFLLAPLYMTHLRQRFERQLPEIWANVTNNGPFTYVSPFLVSTRNHEEGVYAAKVTQIVRHGLPYDPHNAQDRSLRSWLFDSLMFYPLAPFAWLCGGDVQRGWILAHATFGTLWVLCLYILFLHITKDSRYSLFFATGTFFFIDSLEWIFISLLPGLARGNPGDMLFHLAARAAGEIQLMRLPTPGMTYLWLYASLAAVYALSLSPREKTVTALLAGTAVGLLCLAHFYEWVLGTTCLALAFGAARRADIPPAGRWNVAVAAAAAAFLSVSYYVLARHLTHDVMTDIIMRMGDIRHRSFDAVSLFYFAYALFFFWQAKKRPGPLRWLWTFGAVQILASALLLNIQMVLRYNIQFGHFAVLGALSSAFLLMSRLAELQSLKKRLQPHIYVLIAAIFGWVGLREKAWSDTHYKIFGTPRDVQDAAQWLNQNVPRNSLLLLISGTLTEFLPLKVQMRYLVFNGAPSFGSPLPTDQNIQGLAAILKTVRADL